MEKSISEIIMSHIVSVMTLTSHGVILKMSLSINQFFMFIIFHLMKLNEARYPG